MKVKQDYMYMFTLENGESGFAFCTSTDIEKEQAKRHIETVLQERKQKEIKMLNFLGRLDYDQMDPGIVDQLSLFEKYDPVWLCMIQNLPE